MSKKTLKPVVLAASAVMLGGLALSGSAFAMSPLAQGYLLAASAGDDKPTEGQCGADHAAAATATAGDAAADNKAEEGSCGEGQCGADRMQGTPAAGAAAADDKAGEGRCGEGSCGADHAEGAATDEDKAHAEGTCNG